jgi:hypothetical protein
MQDYIETPVKKPSKGAGKRVAVKSAEQLGTPTLLWLIVRRHKLGLLFGYGIATTILLAFPFVPALLVGLVTGL